MPNSMLDCDARKDVRKSSALWKLLICFENIQLAFYLTGGEFSERDHT